MLLLALSRSHSLLLALSRSLAFKFVTSHLRNLPFYRNCSPLIAIAPLSLAHAPSPSQTLNFARRVSSHSQKLHLACTRYLSHVLALPRSNSFPLLVQPPFRSRSLPSRLHIHPFARTCFLLVCARLPTLLIALSRSHLLFFARNCSLALALVPSYFHTLLFARDCSLFVHARSLSLAQALFCSFSLS